MAIAVLEDRTVTEYLPRVHAIASRFNGVGGAEYDDLVQEASEYVVKQVQRGKTPSGTGMRNAMRKWVRKCRDSGISYADPDTL